MCPTKDAKDSSLMANTDTNNTDLARAEILWKAADTLRGQIDAAEYKHVVLGLLFLKYISDSFEARRDELKAELEADGISGPPLESLLENRDEYTAERVFWVPPEARWQNLQNQAARADIALADLAGLLHQRFVALPPLARPDRRAMAGHGGGAGDQGGDPGLWRRTVC